MGDEVLKTRKSSKKAVVSSKNKNAHSIVEDYKLLDGAVSILRTTKSGNFWQMSCWLREEGKCFRKSLRTKDKEQAVQLAREEYFKIQGNIRAGNKIYSSTTRELVDEFVKHKADEAKSGLITEGRVITIRISLNRWFLKFIGENKKLDKISRHDFESYFVWRRQQASDVRNATLINERALISSLFKYGIAHGHLRAEQTLIFPRLNIKKAQVERRDELDKEDWAKMYYSFRRWISKSEHAKEKEQRKFIRDFIVLSANTGLRFGEMRKLKWKMVKIYKSKTVKNKAGEFETHVQISVPQDTKTGARTVIGKRGDVFERIKSYSKYTKADDWVFADNDDGEQIHKKVYYKQWNLLMKECGLVDSNKKLSFYSLRHTYITFRLLSHTDVFMLSKNVGAGIRMIQNHYEHIKSDAMKHELTKKAKDDEAMKILID